METGRPLSSAFKHRLFQDLKMEKTQNLKQKQFYSYKSLFNTNLIQLCQKRHD